MRSKLLSRAFLFIILILVIAPLIVTFFTSFTDGSSFSLQWYRKAFDDNRFTQAVLDSIQLASFVALITTFIAFHIALYWWDETRRNWMFVLIFLWGVIPPEVVGVTFSILKNYLGWYSLSILIHGFALFLGIFPYCLLILWGMLSLFDVNLIRAARDLGANNYVLIYKIIFPLSLPAVISSLLLSFLLSLNELAKTYYLSGATQYLSEYLNGKLMSGADPSVFAAGGLNVGIALIFLLLSRVAYSAIWQRRN